MFKPRKMWVHSQDFQSLTELCKQGWFFDPAPPEGQYRLMFLQIPGGLKPSPYAI